MQNRPVVEQWTEFPLWIEVQVTLVFGLAIPVVDIPEVEKGDVAVKPGRPVGFLGKTSAVQATGGPVVNPVFSVTVQTGGASTGRMPPTVGPVVAEISQNDRRGK